MLALYSCRRAGRLHNNHDRHEMRVYEYNGKFYLTSMAKFTFNLIYRDKNGEFIDDENVWVSASDKLDALAKVKIEYPRASSYTLIKSE